MSDWEVAEAVSSAKEDGEWEKDVDCPKSSDIQISVKLRDGFPVDLKTTGAGLQPKSAATAPVAYGLPAIATKNVRPQDIYNVRSVLFCCCLGDILQYYTK